MAMTNGTNGNGSRINADAIAKNAALQVGARLVSLIGLPLLSALAFITYQDIRDSNQALAEQVIQIRVDQRGFDEQLNTFEEKIDEITDDRYRSTDAVRDFLRIDQKNAEQDRRLGAVERRIETYR